MDPMLATIASMPLLAWLLPLLLGLFILYKAVTFQPLMRKIAFRSIFRQRRRSILTALTMFGGFVLSSISFGMQNGMYDNMIDTFTRNKTGHVQVHHESWLDDRSIYKTISDYEKLSEKLIAQENVEKVSPRLYSGGLFSVGNKTTPGSITGIDPTLENETFKFDKQILDGGKPLSSDYNSCLLGEGLATTLNAKVGDTLYILSQGADGSMANDMYTINGLVNTGNQMADKASLYLPLNQMQELFVLEGKVHELAVVSPKKGYARTLAAELNPLLPEKLTAHPWQKFMESFYKLMKADVEGAWYSLGIINIIVAFGILNTVLMAVMERQREYGVLKALGTKPMQIFMMILYEMGILAIFSSIAGSVVAFGINWNIAVNGLSLKEMYNMDSMSFGGLEITHMYGRIAFFDYWFPALLVIVATLIVSILPAIKAARTEPAVTMRAV